ncbi:mitochondrial ribosome small subunit component rps19 [Phaffia rhodozyma]|uniref:Small ribosomal subunit protein uS19m n=1 Tax=Phaffia rhodozyma TaxID=264483 RepID=A0A0F7SW23_PHARH|nr:mitochondrial ribosome small subunit component rps19 [Phaffia rhodozyma]
MIPTVSRMARSAWKGPYFPPFPNLAEHAKTMTPIRTQARNATIVPSFVGLKFEVHNGRRYLPVNVTEEMIGHKLGEFAHTRKDFTFRQTKNKGR